jgi:hypothetical protein
MATYVCLVHLPDRAIPELRVVETDQGRAAAIRICERDWPSCTRVEVVGNDSGAAVIPLIRTTDQFAG